MKNVSKEFVLAGDAIFTIAIPIGAHEKSHYTFRVQHVEGSNRWPESWFAKILSGPDNSSDYSYIGKLDSFTGQVRTTAKSSLTVESFPVRLLNRILARIWTEDHNAYEAHGYQTHHEGRCGRCARRLTTPESVSMGFGPDCAALLNIV
mgnify:FL=1